MVCAMGGRAAEEVVYGGMNVSTGPSNDYQQVYRIARAMVTEYGLSDIFGPISIGKDEYDRISPEQKLLIDKEVSKLVRQSYEDAKRLISSKLPELNTLALELIQKESLTEDEIRELVGLSYSRN